MNKHKAERLARQVEGFWRAQGYAIKAFAARESEVVEDSEGAAGEWTVRTEPPLKNGVPAGARATTARTIMRAFDRAQTDWRKFENARHR